MVKSQTATLHIFQANHAEALISWSVSVVWMISGWILWLNWQPAANAPVQAPRAWISASYEADPTDYSFCDLIAIKCKARNVNNPASSL
jgi:hypothetical protein